MDFSNISILNIMPPNLAADRNVKMVAEAFDGVLRDIIKQIPDIDIIPNLLFDKIVDEMLIDLLAWQFHVDFYESSMPFEIKRELVLKSLDWHTRKGTPTVIEEIVSTVFSKAKVEEWYEYGGFPYRFRVATEEELPDREAMDKLVRAINSVKNTRSYLDKLTSLFEFIEEIESNEESEIRVKQVPAIEEFFRRIKHNGRIARDGHTVRDVETVSFRHNGKKRRDGAAQRNRVYREHSDSLIIPPFRHFSGARDSLAINIKQNLLDEYHGRVYRHRYFKRDMAIKHDGVNPYSASEAVSVISGRISMADQAPPVTDMQDIQVIADMADDMNKYRRHNRAIRRDRKYVRWNFTVEKCACGATVKAFEEHGTVDEVCRVGMRYHRFHNGNYRRNGNIRHNGNVLIYLE